MVDLREEIEKMTLEVRRIQRRYEEKRKEVIEEVSGRGWHLSFFSQMLDQSDACSLREGK